jgi:methionyl-tRNA formyltransferase
MNEASRRQLRIVWIGFHMEGYPALEAILEQGVRVEAVITLDQDASSKRSGVIDYGALCDRFSVPLHRIRHINDAESVELLRRLAPDVAVVLGWSQIIGAEALGTARLGFIGAHASYLPHNRGSAPVNWAIIRGETEGGNTLMWLSEGVDEGEIVDQAHFPIDRYDTCRTVYDKVAASNREMLLRLVPRLNAGESPGRPQPETDESILPRRRPKDGLIDWATSSEEVYDFVRALTRPYPGAFSWLGGKKYIVWDAVLLPYNAYPDAVAGEVVGPALNPGEGEACGQVVACGSGAVVLIELEAEDGSILKGRRLCEAMAEGDMWSNGE